ncbi:MAG: SpoIIE family protein phosphatase [Rhodospirillaceae bacterium]|nr:SpoIIE family protein phosphatase [Rhodospirillaceae bacterium]
MSGESGAFEKVQARLRHVPLKRRITFTVTVYLLATAVMVVAGWRVATLVRSNRAEVIKLHERVQSLSNMKHNVELLQVLGNAYLTSGETVLPMRVRAALKNIETTLALVIPDSEVLDKEPLRLHLSVNGFMEAFEGATVVNGRITEVYWGDFLIPAQRISARLAALSRDPVRAPDGVARAILRAETAFTQARLDVQAFQTSSVGMSPDKAQAALYGVSTQVAAIRQRVGKGDVAAGLEGVASDLNAAEQALMHLTRLFEQRRLLSESNVQMYGRAMINSAGRLSEGLARREVEIQNALDRRLWVTMEMTAGSAFVLLLLGLVANHVIVRSIRDPILRLNAAMHEISEGNWDLFIAPDAGSDEIAEMSRTLVGFKRNALRLREMEVEKREALSREKEETERALEKLDQAHHEIQVLNDRLSEENLRLGMEIDVSRRLQDMLLPRSEELAVIPALDIAAFMEPATEVGGDYYDVLQDGDGGCITIGDVTGHGLESGVVMLMAQSAVRALVLAEEHNLPRLLDVLNRTMFQTIHRMGGEKNLSFTLLDYRPYEGDALAVERTASGRLTVVGQHESVLILRHSGDMEEIDTLPLGLPLGLVENIAEYTEVATTDLYSGDLVVLYSDGITEAASTDGRLFGIEGLRAELLRHRGKRVDEIKDGVIHAVRRHIGLATVYDDMTLLVIRQK